MVFIDNHDENSWNGTVFERLGDNVKNLSVISFTVPGMPLIYSGQEIGIDRRLQFFEKDPIVWPEKDAWGTTEWEIFYQKLVALKTENPALWTAGAGGPIKALHLDNSEVIAFARSYQGNDVVVLVNLAPETQSQVLEMGDLAGSYIDWFTGDELILSEGISVELSANNFMVLTRTQD